MIPSSFILFLFIRHDHAIFLRISSQTNIPILLKAKILFYIVVANILDRLCQFLFSGEILSSLHKLTEEIAQHTAIQFMARVGQKTSAVRQHSDRKADRIEVRSCTQLPVDSVYLIMEPPRRTQLNLRLCSFSQNPAANIA